MKLWDHQQKFLDANPDIAVLAWSAGVGKTRAAIEWVNKRSWATLVLVVCPKAIQQKWKDDMKKWGCQVMSMVVTKEEVKKIEPMSLSSKMLLIADEAHHYTSPLFVAKDRSQVTEAIYKIIRRNQKMPRLFLTATPVRSSPANMHTLLYLTVKQIDWKKYQEYFYRLQQLPFMARPGWMPKPKWQKEMQKLIDKYCNVVLMKDCFDVPIHEYNTVTIELSKETKEQISSLSKNEWEAVKLWYAEHRLESGIEKLEWIKNFSEGEPKIVIVCRYKEQIAQYAKELSKKREVFVLTGDTKDQGQTIKDAQESPECFIIIQAQVCAGFDLDQFSCMIFTSIDFSYVNFTQMHGRINRAHNLHRNRHYYLVAGEKDKLVLEAMDLKQDFDINKNIKNETKRTSI